MKVFPATKRDNDREIMRIELSGEDVELLDILTDRLRVLLKVEEAMDSASVVSPFISTPDVPHCTAEGIDLLIKIVEGWDPLAHTDLSNTEIVYAVTDGHGK